MDAFIAVEQAAHDGAFGNDKHVLPTPAQCDADDYAKGHVVLHGIKIQIEQPRGAIREGVGVNGKPWANRMAAHYGDFPGTVGADGDPVDCFIGPYPESEQIWVINQGFDGAFDEHKCMLGMSDADSAKAAYMNSYTRDWKGFQSMVQMTLADFKKWLAGNTTLPAVEKTVEKTLWNGDEPTNKTLDAVLYQIRRRDTDGLVFDSVTEDEILQDAEDVVTLDAMTSPFKLLPNRMALLQNVMNKIGALQVVGVTVTQPYRVQNVINVAAILALADGQTISVYFRSAGSNITMRPSDELISWKWMLNKLDITIAVARESGTELDLRDVARRVMRLALKNSAAFSRANAGKTQTLESIARLKAQIEEGAAELAALQLKIEAKNAAFAAEAAAEAARVAAVHLDPAELATLTDMGVTPEGMAVILPYTGYAAFAADKGNRELADNLMLKRIIAIRNSLRELGWDGPRYQPLTKVNFDGTYAVDFQSRSPVNTHITNFSISVGCVADGRELHIGDIANDMKLSASALAAQINELLPVAQAPGEVVITGDGADGVVVTVQSDGPVSAAVSDVVVAAVDAALAMPVAVVDGSTVQACPAVDPTADDQVVVESFPCPHSDRVAEVFVYGDSFMVRVREVGGDTMTTLRGHFPREQAIELAKAEAAGTSVPATDADLEFLQAVTDGQADLLADGVSQRIESILAARLEDPAIQELGIAAINAFSSAVVNAARATLDDAAPTTKQVPDPLHDMPAAGARANETEVGDAAQAAAGAAAAGITSQETQAPARTVEPVPERSNFDSTGIVPPDVLTAAETPASPEQAASASGGVPVPEIPVVADTEPMLPAMPPENAGPVPEMPTAGIVPDPLHGHESEINPHMPPNANGVLDNVIETIEPTESREGAGLIQIQQNGQSEKILAAAKAIVGAAALVTEPNLPLSAEAAPSVPEPTITPVADPMPHAEANPNTPPATGGQDDGTVLLDVPTDSVQVDPATVPSTEQVPDPLHDTPPPAALADVNIPATPAQIEAAAPNPVVQREADAAYLDSVIDGAEHGDSVRLGQLFTVYVADDPMQGKWRDAVTAYTKRIAA